MQTTLTGGRVLMTAVAAYRGTVTVMLLLQTARLMTSMELSIMVLLPNT
jgi:hypothetical protein